MTIAARTRVPMPLPINGSTVHAGISHCETYECFASPDARPATVSCWRVNASVDTWIMCDEHAEESRRMTIIHDQHFPNDRDIQLYLPLVIPRASDVTDTAVEVFLVTVARIVNALYSPVRTLAADEDRQRLLDAARLAFDPVAEAERVEKRERPDYAEINARDYMDAVEAEARSL